MRVSPRFQRNRMSRMRAAIEKSPSTVRRSSRHPSSTPESLVDDCCVVDAKPGTCNNAPALRPRAPGLDILRLALAVRNLQPGRPRGRIGEDRAAQTPRGRRHATPRRSASRCHPRGGMAMPSVPPSDLLCLPVSVGHEERLKRMVVSGRCRASAPRNTIHGINGRRTMCEGKIVFGPVRAGPAALRSASCVKRRMARSRKRDPWLGTAIRISQHLCIRHIRNRR